MCRQRGLSGACWLQLWRCHWDGVESLPATPLVRVSPTLFSSAHHLPAHETMADAAPPPSRSRLVGQPLLYAISIFASLGVFLVCIVPVSSLPYSLTHLSSSVTTKGDSFPYLLRPAPYAHPLEPVSCLASSQDPTLNSFSTHRAL